MPTHVRLANAERSEHCHTASYVRVPERLMMPTALFGRPRPRLAMLMYPGMMPILQPPSKRAVRPVCPTRRRPGVMTPGQLGPMRLTPGVVTRTRPWRVIMSCVGMPSVIAQITS